MPLTREQLSAMSLDQKKAYLKQQQLAGMTLDQKREMLKQQMATPQAKPVEKIGGVPAFSEKDWTREKGREKYAPMIGAAIGGVSPIPGGTALGTMAGTAIKDYYHPPEDLYSGGLDAGLDLLKNAVVPGVISKAPGAVSGAVKTMARRFPVYNAIKESTWGPMVSDAVNAAKNSYVNRVILPKMNYQYQRMAGKVVKINPDEFMGVSPEIDSEMNLLKKALGHGQEDASGLMGNVKPQTEIEIPGEEALRLRGKLNELAKYGKQKINDPSAVAKGEAAANAGNNMRGKIAEADPEMAGVPRSHTVSGTAEELHGRPGVEETNIEGDYPLMDKVMEQQASNPSAVINPTELGKINNLARFDKLANSNLSQLGQDAAWSQRVLNKSQAGNKIGGWKTMLPNKVENWAYQQAAPTSAAIEPYSSAVLDPLSSVVDTEGARSLMRATPWQKLYEKYNQGE